MPIFNLSARSKETISTTQSNDSTTILFLHNKITPSGAFHYHNTASRIESSNLMLDKSLQLVHCLFLKILFPDDSAPN